MTDAVRNALSAATRRQIPICLTVLHRNPCLPLTREVPRWGGGREYYPSVSCSGRDNLALQRNNLLRKIPILPATHDFIQGVIAMIRYCLMPKADKSHWLPRMFDLYRENMDTIAPSGLPREDARAQWFAAVSPALDKAPRNVLLCTDDGTAGHHGLVTDMLKERIAQGPVDIVYACGPKIMLKFVAKMCQENGIRCQVSLEERMGCGVGACLVCACKTKKENGEETYSHVCKNGPVFEAEKVVFDE